MSSIALSILVVLAAGIVSLLFFKAIRKLQWVVFFISTAFLLYVAAVLYGAWELKEVHSLGIVELSFTNHRLGWVFVAMSTGLTLLIALFSLSYNDKKHATSVAPLWTMLMAANTGIFLAADWITFLIAWELMGWTSFFIISHGKEKSFKAGIYYYALSLIGASALLGGIFLVQNITGTFAIGESLELLKGLWAASPGLLYGIIILFLVAFFTKSALGPFYMWPAKAHAEAPDDFSAFLSGIMIKYGVYGIVLLVVPLFSTGYPGPGYIGPLVQGTPVFLYVVGWIGAFTAVWGTLLAVRENDMKRLMAFSTVSNLGFILIALSVNTWFGIAAALFHTFNHMVFKGTIFLSLASVKFRTGERLMHRLGGIGYRMPVAFLAFLLGIIAAAGIPPMSGFASKWMVFQSLFSNNLLILAIPAFFASTAAFLYLYRGLHSIYLGQLSPRFKDIKPAPPLQSAVMVLLMLFIFAVGAFPGIVLGPINEAVAAAGGQAVETDLYSIMGVTSQVNLTVVAAVFVGSFLIVLALYLIGKGRTHVEPLDTYTAGETPEDWDMTAEQYHYAYNFYEPFEKIFHPILERVSCEKWFDNIAHNARRVSTSVAAWITRPGSGAMLVTGGVLIILFLGIVVW